MCIKVAVNLENGILLLTSHVTMSGIATLFPAFPSQMPLIERVNLTILRHQHNYFKDWSVDRLESENIPTLARPLSPPLTHEAYQTRIKKNETSRNKRLAYCMDTASTENAPRWAVEFVEQIQSGEISSLTKAKDIASTNWRNHSTDYDSKRAVQLPAENPGTGHQVKRVRQDDETQYQYRKRRATEDRDGMQYIPLFKKNV